MRIRQRQQKCDLCELLNTGRPLIGVYQAVYWLYSPTYLHYIRPIYPVKPQNYYPATIASTGPNAYEMRTAETANQYYKP